MPRSRDRHGRGIRGPLALPHEWSEVAVPLHRPSRTDFFNDCITASLEAITAHNPTALDGIVVGVEEVPHLATQWTGDRVPMSAAVEPTRTKPGQIVVYQRPLERRASSRSHLREIVHHTIVEQLSALTGISITEISGENPDDWDA